MDGDLRQPDAFCITIAQNMNQCCNSFCNAVVGSAPTTICGGAAKADSFSSGPPQKLSDCSMRVTGDEKLLTPCLGQELEEACDEAEVTRALHHGAVRRR